MIILLFSVLAVLAIAVCFRYLTDRSPRMEISFLDVGQGDATLIETPYGQNILIDAGEGDVIDARATETGAVIKVQVLAGGELAVLGE